MSSLDLPHSTRLTARKNARNRARERRGAAGDSSGRAHVAVVGTVAATTPRRAGRAVPSLALPHLSVPSQRSKATQQQPARAEAATRRARRAPPGHAPRPAPTSTSPAASTPPPLAHLVPRAPRSLAAPRANPTASRHALGCPLRRVHRAPARRYKSCPELPIAPHFTTAPLACSSPLPTHRTPLGRAEPPPRAHCCSWPCSTARGKRRLGRAVPRSLLSLFSPPWPSPRLRTASPSRARLFPVQGRRRLHAGVRAAPRKEELDAVAARSLPSPRNLAHELPRAAAPLLHHRRSLPSLEVSRPSPSPSPESQRRPI